jgi:hypothetical protein
LTEHSKYDIAEVEKQDSEYLDMRIPIRTTELCFCALLLLFLVAAIASAVIVTETEEQIHKEQETAAIAEAMKAAEPPVYEKFALAYSPIQAPGVLALFGDDPTFQSVLQHGHFDVISIIARCLKGGDINLDFSYEWLSLGNVFRLKLPERPRHLDGITCSKHAIALTAQARHDFLRQYVIDDAKEAHNLPLSSMLAFLEDFFLFGIKPVERRLALGEQVTVSEGALALLNVAALGAGKFAALGRSAYAARVATKSAARSAPAATRATAIAAARTDVLGYVARHVPQVNAKLVALSVGAGLTYVAAFHPAKFSDLVGTIAEAFGWDPHTLQVAAWTLLIGGAVIAFLFTFSVPLLALLGFLLLIVKTIRLGQETYRLVRA